jgi:hypothetical protein
MRPTVTKLSVIFCAFFVAPLPVVMNVEFEIAILAAGCAARMRNESSMQQFLQPNYLIQT